jgi:hypothetical protein
MENKKISEKVFFYLSQTLVGNRPRSSWRAVNRQENNELAAASQGKILDLKKFNTIFQIFFHYLTVSLLEYKLF